MHAPNLCTVGQSLEGCEVVWNAAIERQWAEAARKPPPDSTSRAEDLADVPLFSSQPAVADAASTRVCDRILWHLERNPYAQHSSRGLAEALGVDMSTAATWLHRFWQRGVLVLENSPKSRREARLYRVRQEAAA